FLDLRVLGEKLDDADDEVAEIDGAPGLQRALVAIVHADRDLAGNVPVGHLYRGGQDALVLPAIDARQMLAGRPEVDAQVLAGALGLGERIGLVVDGEGARKRERLRFAPEEA